MIGNAVLAMIKSNAAITTAFGTNIFPVIIPQEIKGNVLIFGVKSIEVEHSKDASHLNAVEVDIHIYSKDYPFVQNQSRKVRDVLNKNKGTFSGIEISDVEFQDYSDDYDTKGERFCGILTFHFFTDENF